MTDSEQKVDLKAAFLEQERLEKSGRLHWFHWLIVLASLILTFGAWNFTRSQHQDQIRERFDRQATQVVELVIERMQQYESFLNSGAAAIESKYVPTDHKAWRRYSETLNIQKKYPGINGIGFIDHLQRADLETYLATQKVQRPEFKIFPAHEESELFPIVFIEPIEYNIKARGLDMAHENNRYTAAKIARDTGNPQITGPIELVQDDKKTPGFLFFSPVYAAADHSTISSRRESFNGLVYAPFNFDRLMQGTLENEKRQVGLMITDRGSLLYDENHKGVLDFDANPMFKTEKIINMYGRDWTFEIWSKASFNRAAVTNKPRLILIGGLAIDSLLLTLFILLAQANRRAISFATRMADAQKADAARLNNIIENTIDGMMTTGVNRNIHSFNKACEHIFGYTASEMIGQDLILLFPNLLEDTNSEIGGEGKVENLEVLGQRRDGSNVPLEVSASAINVEGKTLFNIMIRDITSRKKADEDLKQAMDELILSNEELEKFAYIASHDLKSPLRSIDNLSKWLEEDLDQQLDDKNRERLATLRGRVARMDNLLDDLLQYSRAGFNTASTKSVKASEIVRNVWDVLFVPEHFKLSIDNSLNDIQVAQMPLQQVLHNLINNAIKHHDKDTGLISVSCEEKGEFYVFSVTDDGPGISPEYHRKIFEMFQTLQPRDKVEGSGMGLALVKKIVYCFGGTITVTSEIGVGSSFKFTWPKVLKERIRPSREDRFNAAEAS